jgi:hypothetical protein
MQANMMKNEQADPFNCPDCGSHDFGLYVGSIGECPHCLKSERDFYKHWLHAAAQQVFGDERPINWELKLCEELRAKWLRPGDAKPLFTPEPLKIIYRIDQVRGSS